MITNTIFKRVNCNDGFIIDYEREFENLESMINYIKHKRCLLGLYNISYFDTKEKVRCGKLCLIIKDFYWIIPDKDSEYGILINLYTGNKSMSIYGNYDFSLWGYSFMNKNYASDFNKSLDACISGLNDQNVKFKINKCKMNRDRNPYNAVIFDDYVCIDINLEDMKKEKLIVNHMEFLSRNNIYGLTRKDFTSEFEGDNMAVLADEIISKYKYMNPETYELSNIKDDNYTIEIDSGIADIISELNKKGYKTRFCCEGHPDNPHAYIMFDNNVSIRDIKSISYNTDFIWIYDERTFNHFPNKAMEVNGWKLFSTLHDEDINLYNYYKNKYLSILSKVVHDLPKYEQPKLEIPRVSKVNMINKDKKKGIEIQFRVLKSDLYDDFLKLGIGDNVVVNNHSFKITDFSITNKEIIIKAFLNCFVDTSIIFINAFLNKNVLLYDHILNHENNLEEENNNER